MLTTAMALGAVVFVMCIGSIVQFLFLRGLRKHHQGYGTMQAGQQSGQIKAYLAHGQQLAMYKDVPIAQVMIRPA